MLSLEEAIKLRHSRRSYAEGDVTQEEIDKLLWAANCAPSAGGIRPLKIYVVREEEQRKQLCAAALYQEAVRNAPVSLVVAADYDKIMAKYKRRGSRYAILEAGHVGQNIALQAVALGLGTVMIGAFRDGAVKKVLGIPEDPLYIIPVGRDKTIGGE